MFIHVNIQIYKIIQCYTFFDGIIKLKYSDLEKGYDGPDDEHVCTEFISLPTPEQLPVYYKTIKTPIDFALILHKLGTYV